MNVKELKELIKDLDDNVEVGRLSYGQDTGDLYSFDKNDQTIKVNLTITN